MSTASIRKRLHEIMDRARSDDTPSLVFDVTILSLILVNTAAVILETVPSLYLRYDALFVSIEAIITIIFTAEYLLRFWAVGRLRYIFTPLAMVDLLAILPFYLPLFFPVEAGLLRSVRLFRLFRVFKAARYTQATNTFTAVLKLRREELFISFVVMVLMLLFASAALYLVESEAQPDAFASIPHAAWWAVSTLTTVGYGDVVPITPFGKFLGALIALAGVGIFALPSAIMASGFFEVLSRRRGYIKACPR